MPFTLSHPAAVLPLLGRTGGRGPLVASALVAGSTVPDLPYFADSVLHGAFGFGSVTHAWWGVPTVDVVLTALVVLVWHTLLRAPLVALLPPRAAAAAEAHTAPVRPRRAWARPAAVAWFAVSAAVGAGTHAGWDSFTHHDRAGIRLLPVLARPVAGVPLYQVLQYGSSALALGILAYCLGRLLRTAGDNAAAGPVRPAPWPRPLVLGLTAGAALLGAAHRVVRRWTLLPDSPLVQLVPTTAFGAAAGAALALTGYAALAQATRRRRRD
ncbi:hypothetical protein GCM10010495_45140 [Kitasatospora herbaricolor]|uniref:DUF4184 family protein n=1 Tax=Kitasatospora herbaricolor TaxID=68217 RepID=UPI00174AE805|nr:DUF4184 family protein [Kitasatospora herbaricolor]MDQ0313051.1 hypothetical protein [Kitasatospora herbaricolor]GGV24516.1 hypothetical protein GCM10010495_45140 [Kitasatospora herbaricolor]